MSKAELETRGKKLRQMFDPYIERANGKENWKLDIWLEKEAEEYFPKGMSFEDAIVVLTAAGFHIIPRPLPREDNTKYWLLATMSFPNRYIYKTLIGVQLEPNELQLDNVYVKSSVITVGVN